MTGLDDLRREAEALDRDATALRRRLQALRERPKLVGPGVAAAWEADIEALEREAAALEQRAHESTARMGAWRPEDEPGWPGRIARLPAAVGIAAGVGLSLVSVLIWARTADAVAVDRDFYVAAVQLIPVLLLALVVEARFFDPRRHRYKVLRGYYGIYLLWIVAGEVAGLAVVAGAAATGVAFGLVCTAIVNALTVIVLEALIPATP